MAISPKPGKEARVAELATQCAAQVKAHEPWISMYRVLGGKKLDDDKLECFFVVARSVSLTVRSLFLLVDFPFLFGGANTVAGTESKT